MGTHADLGIRFLPCSGPIHRGHKWSLLDHPFDPLADGGRDLQTYEMPCGAQHRICHHAFHCEDRGQQGRLIKKARVFLPEGVIQRDNLDADYVEELKNLGRGEIRGSACRLCKGLSEVQLCKIERDIGHALNACLMYRRLLSPPRVAHLYTR